MTLLGPGQIGASPAATRTQPVAKGAVETELELPHLGDLGVAGVGVITLPERSYRHGQQQDGGSRCSKTNQL